MHIVNLGRAMFRDRADAGEQLAAALAEFQESRPVVLALPRGGVPVGFAIARELGAPLDVLLVRKIGAPGQPELGLGALVDGVPPRPVLDQPLIALTEASESYLEGEVRRQTEELTRRRARYGAAVPLIAGRTVIVVDDGIATGGTMRAALAGLAPLGARRMVVAVPVAPRSALTEIAETATVVCLHAVEDFGSVGGFYDDFTQVEDEVVIRLLSAARR